MVPNLEAFLAIVPICKFKRVTISGSGYAKPITRSFGKECSSSNLWNHCLIAQLDKPSTILDSWKPKDQEPAAKQLFELMWCKIYMVSKLPVQIAS